MSNSICLYFLSGKQEMKKHQRSLEEMNTSWHGRSEKIFFCICICSRIVGDYNLNHFEDHYQLEFGLEKFWRLQFSVRVVAVKVVQEHAFFLIGQKGPEVLKMGFSRICNVKVVLLLLTTNAVDLVNFLECPVFRNHKMLTFINWMGLKVPRLKI